MKKIAVLLGFLFAVSIFHGCSSNDHEEVRKEMKGYSSHGGCCCCCGGGGSYGGGHNSGPMASFQFGTNPTTIITAPPTATAPIMVDAMVNPATGTTNPIEIFFNTNVVTGGRGGPGSVPKIVVSKEGVSILTVFPGIRGVIIPSSTPAHYEVTLINYMASNLMGQPASPGPLYSGMYSNAGSSANVVIGDAALFQWP